MRHSIFMGLVRRPARADIIWCLHEQYRVGRIVKKANDIPDFMLLFLLRHLSVESGRSREIWKQVCFFFSISKDV